MKIKVILLICNTIKGFKLTLKILMVTREVKTVIRHYKLTGQFQDKYINNISFSFKGDGKK